MRRRCAARSNGDSSGTLRRASWHKARNRITGPQPSAKNQPSTTLIRRRIAPSSRTYRRASDRKDAGFTLRDLCAEPLAFAAQELRQAGFLAMQLNDSGFTRKVLKTAGFMALELKEAGFSLRHLCESGFDVLELKGVDRKHWDHKHDVYQFPFWWCRTVSLMPSEREV